MAVTPVDLLLSGGFVISQADQLIVNGAVAVAGDRIVAVGVADEMVGKYEAKKVMDCTGRVVMPGLINCHTHTCQSTATGLADDIPVTQWLSRIVPFEAALEEEDATAAVRLACLEMIKSGTTGFMEGCATPHLVDAVGQVFVESGMRAILTRSTMEHADTTWDVPESFLLDAATNLLLTREMIERWHGTGEGRVSAWPSFRHAQDVTDELIVDLVGLMDEYGVGLHGHQSTREYGEVEHLSELGVLRQNMVFAHGIRYTQPELELLRAADVSINHNPGGSMHGAYGASALGLIPEMVEMGIRVALGCDGAANNNTLDMFREMKLAATIHSEARLDATLVPAQVAFQMGTINGAQACMWEDVGMLAPGMRADLIVVNVMRPHLVPHHNLLANLVYCANGNDVDTTIVDGRVLMEDRHVLVFDESQVIEEAIESADRVKAR